MAKLEDTLTEMLEAPVEALGYELLGLEFVRAGRHSTLRLYIDHPNGITVDDCAQVSHQVSAVMDVEDPISSEYNLEISSPGADRPLFKPAHYQQFVGETISLRTRLPIEGRRNYKGELKNADEASVTLEVDKQAVTLQFRDIEKANLVPTF